MDLLSETPRGYYGRFNKWAAPTIAGENVFECLKFGRVLLNENVS